MGPNDEPREGKDGSWTGDLSGPQVWIALSLVALVVILPITCAQLFKEEPVESTRPRLRVASEQTKQAIALELGNLEAIKATEIAGNVIRMAVEKDPAADWHRWAKGIGCSLARPHLKGESVSLIVFEGPAPAGKHTFKDGERVGLGDCRGP